MSLSLTRRRFLASAAALAVPSLGRAADPAKGLVTGQLDAAAAGNAVLAAGGNAVDAIVAAALVAGVVAVPSTGIAGYGGHLTLARPDGKVFAIDFNSAAPAAAKPDMFDADEKGNVKGQVNKHGWLAAGVPGVLAGLQAALDKWGTKPLAELAKPAIKFARDGFRVSRGLANSIRIAADRFGRDPGSAKLFLRNGQPLAEGDTFRNPDLAALLQALAEKGRVDDFYTGKIAEQIAAAFKKNGGLVTAADLAAYKAADVTPLSLEWRGYTVYTPPPTAGGLTALQALGTLKALAWETWDFRGPNGEPRPAAVQARVEALRIAWADRLRLLGDPKFADVPVGKLMSEQYAKESAERVRAAVLRKKPVEGGSDGRPGGGTIHLTAIDPSGMAVALTFTHGDGFGTCVAVDGLGLILGHGMSRFDPRPGRPNSVGPGKRPLHNMCPTVLTKEGKPVLALGATGGRRIPNTVFDVLAYRLGEGRQLPDAVKAPRMHTEGDLYLTLEAAWAASVTEHLKRVGYAVRTGGAATLNAIERDPATGDVRPAAR